MNFEAWIIGKTEAGRYILETNNPNKKYIIMPNNQVAAKIVEAGGKLTVKSALNPILWLSAIVLPVGLVLGFLPSISVWLMVFISTPVAAALFGFLYLLIKDPDKLQSEKYQIQKRSLELLGDKDGLLKLGGKPTPNSYKQIENPEQK